MTDSTSKRYSYIIGSHPVYTHSECKQLWQALLHQHAYTVSCHNHMSPDRYLKTLFRTPYCYDAGYDTQPLLDRYQHRLGREKVTRILNNKETKEDLHDMVNAVRIAADEDEEDLLRSASPLQKALFYMKKIRNFTRE